MTTKITSANIDTTSVATATSANTANFNIALLGFKMAITEGLTVFNLIDGIVDEFEDEGGVDNSASTSLTYNSTDDYYVNSTQPDGLSIPTLTAGFTTTSITEPDTSTAGTNPTYGSGTFGTYTVPSGKTSINVYAWGAGGGKGLTSCNYSGSGGFASGTLAVTPSQTIQVVVGEGGTFAGQVSPQTRSLGGGGALGRSCGQGPSPNHFGGGGGLSGIMAPGVPIGSGTPAPYAPQIYLVAGAGGGSGYSATALSAGPGGGLIGNAGGNPIPSASSFEQSSFSKTGSGGGGSQTDGGQASNATYPGRTPTTAQSGLFLAGGNSNADDNSGAGGSGYYGGGGAGHISPQDDRLGGGGSSYYGHPQISSGSTEDGDNSGVSGGSADPYYPSIPNVGTGKIGPDVAGGDGHILITTTGICASTTSSTIISDPFTSNTVPTTTRIVVFEENVGSPTLNTDIIASVSRNGGTNFTTVTLTDSGYVTGSSGQRILTGQASVSGQPSGQSMKWKLELANQTVKIHGVSLQWS